MKQTSKKRIHKMTEDGDSPPPAKRTADEFDTAYFIAEATLNEQPEPTRPAPASEPPAPAVVSPPLAPMAALWPNPTLGAVEHSQVPTRQVQTIPAKAAVPQALPTPAAQSAKPPTQSEPARSLGKAAAVAETKLPPASPRIKVTFILPELGAKQVSLCGEFNGWSPDATPMKRHDGGQWETTVVLAPGRYQYKFVVDGQWIPDPLAHENVWNGHGTLNSVVEVRA